MSFNDSFAEYLFFEIMMRVLNNKIEKMTLNVKIIIICNILFFPISSTFLTSTKQSIFFILLSLLAKKKTEKHNNINDNIIAIETIFTFLSSIFHLPNINITSRIKTLLTITLL